VSCAQPRLPRSDGLLSDERQLPAAHQSSRDFGISGRSFQFGRTSTRLPPHWVRFIRAIKLGTVVSARSLDTSINASCWQRRQETSSRCTPSSRMLPNVIGGPGGAWLAFLPLDQPCRGWRFRILDLDPIRRSPRPIGPIPPLGHYAFEPDLSGMLKHSVAVGLHKRYVAFDPRVSVSNAGCAA
jgi:hypothetical protein